MKLSDPENSRVARLSEAIEAELTYGEVHEPRAVKIGRLIAILSDMSDGGFENVAHHIRCFAESDLAGSLESNK